MKELDDLLAALDADAAIRRFNPNTTTGRDVLKAYSAYQQAVKERGEPLAQLEQELAETQAELDKCWKALTAIKEAGSKGEARRIAIQALGGE